LRGSPRERQLFVSLSKTSRLGFRRHPQAMPMNPARTHALSAGFRLFGRLGSRAEVFQSAKHKESRRKRLTPATARPTNVHDS
jgi:hypothetical protein